MRTTDQPFDPYIRIEPRAAALPLVCDSPHSGVVYPADFGYAVDAQVLRTGEDTHVDALWRGIPEVGGTLILAQFPRTYIDPNREPDDIDPALLAGPWPDAIHPSEKSRIGHGLIWSKAGGRPIYDRKLSVEEVRHRIQAYHRPYHAALSRDIEAAYKQFGAVWHLNLHSMPSNSYEVLQVPGNRQLADFVLGDRDGTTCEPELVDVVEHSLRASGYTVARNDPFKGVALIARLGKPAQRRHSLQIEIHRGQYMNEQTFEKNEKFPAMQAALTKAAQDVAQYIQRQL
ncbi:N-formylglutamate amidohydrolase [Bordetella genomosp. 9]|uniref:N-formylglutamate amidohydrolase n=1 Tax=Bordetella genomosp. 9 TaxID=1416803 RepID=A0A261R7X3_9BORD|nr:N-formylglutamate amidohydrolase [Bordetella genomosp. 9]OZI21088.1 N-formylglutamate amidohydrolase [Bordetella genomosp. 9]